jgi:hypothetical protein
MAAQVELLSAILKKLPIPHTSERMAVDLSTTAAQSAYQAWIVNATSNTNGTSWYRTQEPWDFSATSATSIYTNITVS